MDLRRWTHVVAVADHRSFVRAAEHVHLSQPALTRSIQAAEAELGMPLFDRGPTAITVTPAGEFVIARARQLVFDSRCLARDVALYRNRQLGDTAFGIGPFPAATFLPGLLARLRREHPQVNLRVEINNWHLLLQRLLEEDIEFFVADIRDLPAHPQVRVDGLRREPGGLYVRAGHPLPRRKPVSLAQVNAYGIASVRMPNDVRALLARLVGAPSADDVKLALECDDIEVLKTVALQSDAVLAAPHAAVAKELAARSLRLLDVTGLPVVGAQMGVVTLRGRTPSPMAALILGLLPADEA